MPARVVVRACGSALQPPQLAPPEGMHTVPVRPTPAAPGRQLSAPSPRFPHPCRRCSDLLRAYAALQRFRPAPFKSACYTGDLLLGQFAAPHAWDGRAVEQAYPWLRGYDAGGLVAMDCITQSSCSQRCLSEGCCARACPLLHSRVLVGSSGGGGRGRGAMSASSCLPTLNALAVCLCRVHRGSGGAAAAHRISAWPEACGC